MVMQSGVLDMLKKHNCVWLCLSPLPLSQNDSGFPPKVQSEVSTVVNGPNRDSLLGLGLSVRLPVSAKQLNGRNGESINQTSMNV